LVLVFLPVMTLLVRLLCFLVVGRGVSQERRWWFR
jgi:hypothetical protein